MVRQAIWLLLTIAYGFFLPGSAYLKTERLDLDFVLAHRVDETDPAQAFEAPSPFTLRQVSELAIATNGLIKFYQMFISSQDMDVCNFTPSCSRFGAVSVRQYGVIIGSLMASDRLQRCNGCGHPFYPVHPVTGKLSDPPERAFPSRSRDDTGQ